MLKIWTTGASVLLFIYFRLWFLADLGVAPVAASTTYYRGQRSLITKNNSYGRQAQIRNVTVPRRMRLLSAHFQENATASGPRTQTFSKYSKDMLLNPLSSGRTLLRSGLWTKEGIIFLYSQLRHDALDMCIFEEAVNLIRLYSCIPVYGFEISVRCASKNDPLDCARRRASRTEPVDSYKAMVQAGVLEKMLAAKDYVLIIDEGDNICQSHFGRIGGKQELWLAQGCMIAGVILHEMLHALGYAHEHCRQDRDDYVNIYFENIIQGEEHNFRKVDNKLFQDFGNWVIK